MGYQKAYFFLGCAFSIVGIFLATVFIIIEGTFPSMGYMYISLVFMCFCLSYLAPQFQRNDERTKFIRQKAMFYSFFSIIGYLIVLLALLNFNVIVFLLFHIFYLFLFFS